MARTKRTVPPWSKRVLEWAQDSNPSGRHIRYAKGVARGQDGVNRSEVHMADNSAPNGHNDRSSESTNRRRAAKRESAKASRKQGRDEIQGSVFDPILETIDPSWADF